MTLTLSCPDESRGKGWTIGEEGADGKRGAAGGLQITGCIVSPFDPPVTAIPIDRARVYTAMIAEKGAFYPAESEAYWPSAAVTGCIDVYVATLSKPRSRPSRGRPSYLRGRKENSVRSRKGGERNLRIVRRCTGLLGLDEEKFCSTAPVKKVVRIGEKLEKFLAS